MKIEVTQEDIGKSLESCAACPIENAIARIYKQDWRVGYSSCHRHPAGKAVELPKKAKDFIKLFDAHKPVKPISLKLNYKP